MLILRYITLSRANLRVDLVEIRSAVDLKLEELWETYEKIFSSLLQLQTNLDACQNDQRGLAFKLAREDVRFKL